MITNLKRLHISADNGSLELGSQDANVVSKQHCVMSLLTSTGPAAMAKPYRIHSTMDSKSKLALLTGAQ